MNRVRHATTAALFALLLVGCGDDNTIGPKPAEIMGNWTATKVEYVSKAAPATRVDVIGLGTVVVLRFNTDHSLLYIETESAGSPVTTRGVWSLDEGILRVTPSGMSLSWEWSAHLSGNTLTLSGADMEYDFDGNGFPEAADQNMTLVR